MKSEKKGISEIIDITQERFNALKPSLSFEAEKGFAMQILYNNSYLYKVAKTHNVSLAQAITNVAAIGLSLNPVKKQAYLIARTVKENNQYVSKIFLEPSYMGLCDLATDSGSIEWIQARVVRENDEFIDNGFGQEPTHSYKPFDGAKRGEIIGVFCTAKLSTGDYLTTTMEIAKINDIMERSEAVKAVRAGKSKHGGPWFTDFEEQAKKTVVRNAFKMWPKTNLNQLETAVHLSNENEGFEPLVTSPSIGQFTGEQKEYFDQLIEKNDALRMFVFSQSFKCHGADSEEASIWISLLHSFERGSKGKYQEIVKNLVDSGNSIFIDYVDQIECYIGNDEEYIKQLLREIDNDTIKLLQEKVNPEYAMDLGKIIKGMEQ